MKTLIKLIGVTGLILLIGCGEKFSDDDFLFGPSEQYDIYIESGWENFKDGNYPDAITAFSNASERDATQPEVYLGLGWSYARNLELTKAESNLQKALSFAFFDTLQQGKITTEALAGIGVVKLAGSAYEDCIMYVDSVLAKDNTFAFSMDSTVNATQLKLAKAESHYYLNEIEKCFVLLHDMGMLVGDVENMVVEGTISHGEYFVDADGSGSWDDGEYLDDRNGNGVWDSDNTTDKGEMLVSGQEGHYLISGTAVELNGVSYEILKTYEGTRWILISGNPVVDAGHIVVVTYFFTEDYSTFLNNLISLITGH